MAEETVGYLEVDLERRLLRDVGTIVLNGQVDSVMAKQAIVDIMLLVKVKKVEEITIILNSPGGEIEFGMGIIDAIRFAQINNVKIVGKVYGHAMSMMLDVLQACDWRTAGEGSWLMAHGGIGASIGDLRDSKARVQLAEGEKDYAARLYAWRNTSSEDKYHEQSYWEDMFESATPNFYSAREGLEMGLIDEIEGVKDEILL